METTFLLLIGALALSLLLRMTDGTISTRGMLLGPSGQPDPERMLHLLTTLALAGWYLAQGLALLGAAAPPKQLPEVPDWMLLALAGSHGAFLSAKYYRNII